MSQDVPAVNPLAKRRDAAQSATLVDRFLAQRMKTGTFITCTALGAKLHWRECANRHGRKRMIRSFGRKLEQFATPQDRRCRECPIGAKMTGKLDRMLRARRKAKRLAKQQRRSRPAKSSRRGRRR